MIALGRVILGEKQPRFGLERATVKVSRIEIFVGLLKTLKVRSVTDVNILASFGARDPSSRDHCEERTRFSCKAVRVNFLLQAFRPIARRAPAFSFNRIYLPKDKLEDMDVSLTFCICPHVAVIFPGPLCPYRWAYFKP